LFIFIWLTSVSMIEGFVLLLETFVYLPKKAGKIL